MSRRADTICYVLALCMVMATGLILHGQKRLEIIPNPPPLESFPTLIGTWHGHPEEISDSVREVLGESDVLSRTYDDGHGQPVGLFVAYFRSQTRGQTMHSPKNCLPGSGWMPVESLYATISTPAGPQVVNRYIIQRADRRAMVLYWYQAHGRVIASEYWAKFYLMWDAARLHRSDGSLVRIVTPIADNEMARDAELRATNFAHQVTSKLEGYIPH